MKKIIVIAALFMICAVSAFCQNNTRIPTAYVVDEYIGNIEFKECIFTFDTVSNFIGINMKTDSIVVGEFNGIIHFYNEKDELMKDCKVIVIGDATGNAYTTDKCGCVIPFILTQSGSVKVEVNINSRTTIMCIVLCDKFKI